MNFSFYASFVSLAALKTETNSKN